MANLEDQVLVNLSRGGDLDAFNTLVERYQDAVFSVTLKMSGNRAVAEDLTQNTFISAFRNILKFRGGNFRAWLLRIARNASYDHLRSYRRRREISMDEDAIAFSETMESTDPGPEELVLTDELARMLARGLHTLSNDHRLAVVMVDIEGYAYEETAQVMGVSLGTLKSRLNRARGRLRDFLTSTPGTIAPRDASVSTESRAK